MTVSPRVAFVTENLGSNSLGRTYCLWQLSEKLGWSSSIVAPTGDEVWGPLRGTPFADSCSVMTPAAMAVSDQLRSADVIVAVKPLPNSFGVALELSATLGTPLVLDIDDPDLELRLSWERPLRRLAKGVVKRPAVQEWKRLRKAALSLDDGARIVSNPVLQSRYGGTLIPHVRADRGPGATHVRREPVVAFIGTNRGHKGLPLLREAIDLVHDSGFSLVVTADPPDDAKPWETWVGPTTFDEGMALLGDADVVIIPSEDGAIARGQLPAKLIDAMFAGRAIGISTIEPQPWALGGHGRTFTPGSVSELVKILLEFRDPELRNALGFEARQRALSAFGLSGNVDSFQGVVSAAAGRRGAPNTRSAP